MRAAVHSYALIDLIRSHVPDVRLGIEVGVERGRTSRVLLNEFRDLILVAIDPWAEFPVDHLVRQWADRRRNKTLKERFAAHAFKPQSEHDLIRDRAINMLKQFRNRICIMPMESKIAAGMLRDADFDFVFLDGDHTQCGADIELFWPKLKSGGLLAGHDYNSRLSSHGVWDVNRAVDAFVTKTGLPLLRKRSRIWGAQKPKVF